MLRDCGFQYNPCQLRFISNFAAVTKQVLTSSRNDSSFSFVLLPLQFIHKCKNVFSRQYSNKLCSTSWCIVIIITAKQSFYAQIRRWPRTHFSNSSVKLLYLCVKEWKCLYNSYRSDNIHYLSNPVRRNGLLNCCIVSFILSEYIQNIC